MNRQPDFLKDAPFKAAYLSSIERKNFRKLKKDTTVNSPNQIIPQTLGKIFLHSHLSFTAVYSLKSEKDLSVDFAKLQSRKADSVCVPRSNKPVII